MDGDATLRSQLVGAALGELPAVPDHTQRGGADDRGVEEPVHALGHGVAIGVDEARSFCGARHDQVRTQRTDQFGVPFRGVGDDAQATVAGELNRVPAQRARRSGDGEGGARRQVQEGQREVGGEAVHRQAGHIAQVQATGRGNHLIDRHHDVLRLGAARRPERIDERHDRCADFEVDALTHRVDDSGGVHARDVRGLELRYDRRQFAFTQQEVRGVDRCAGDANADVLRPGVGQRALDHLQHLGLTELLDSNGAHTGFPFVERMDGHELPQLADEGRYPVSETAATG